MLFLLVIAALIFAALEWFFEYKKNLWGIYLTKPTVMLLLIVFVWFYADVPILMFGLNTSAIIWFIFGLVFCLGGDVCLMLPERFFLPGLISFLLGHIFYIAGFGMPIPPSGKEIPAIVNAAILILVSGWIYVQLAKGMQDSGKDRMRIPVLIYTIVIALMLFSALLTLFNHEWALLPSILVSGGALLFMFSDIVNAWVRFVGPIPNHRLWIMPTYHLAQVGISVGVAIHFTNMTILTL